MQPTSAELLEGKFQHEASFHAGSPSGNYFWYRKRLQVTGLVRDHLGRLGQSASADQPRLMVDLGCGEGTDLVLIRDVLQASSESWTLLGLEGSPLHFHVAELRREFIHAADVRATNLEFRRADITAPLPLPDASVDLLYCSEVVEHLPEPEMLFREVVRVLRPGGHFLLTTPNEPNPFQRPYWLPSARKRLATEVEELRRTPKVVEMDGREIHLYEHISCRPWHVWDRLLAKEGFRLVDFHRGALMYGGNARHDHPLVLGVRFLLEAVLDLLPRRWVRSLSGEVIALYQLDPPKT